MGNNHKPIVVFFLVIISLINQIQANANVGCLFGDHLCEPSERCFADNAFGRCISEYATPTEEDLYRFSLDPASLSALEVELERMLALGYGWRHPYTQCTIQSLLQAIQYDNYYDPDGCSDLSDPTLEARALQDLERAPPIRIMPPMNPVFVQEAIMKQELNPKANIEMNNDDLDKGEDDEEEKEPPHLAFVKFTPSASDPHADFADEIYIPNNYNNFDQQDQVAENTKILETLTGLEAPPGFLRRFAYLNQKNDNTNLNKEENAEDSEEEIDANLWRRRRPNLLKKSIPWFQKVSDNYIPINTENEIEYEQPGVSFDIPTSLSQPLSPMDLPDEFQYYNTPELFRAGFETRDSLEPGQIQQEHLSNHYPVAPIINAGYTEGGVVHVGQDNKQLQIPTMEEVESAQVAEAAEALDDGLDALLEWGRFQRRERLDVKKPGPLYSTNNYAFNKQTDDTTIENTGIEEDPNEIQQQIQQPDKIDENDTSEDDKEPYESPSKKEMITPTKESTSAVHDFLKSNPQESLLDDGHYDIVDTSFAYIEFTHSIRTWQEGEKIVNDVSRVLHLPPKTLTHIRVDRNEVTFKVEANDQGLNASQIARKLADMKDELKDILGLEVTGVGIGDKTKLPTAVVAPRLDSQQQLYLALLACAMLAGLCTAAAALLLVRRARTARAKLSGLATAHDSEPSKDYQDLCRARMKGSAVAASSSNDKSTSGSNDNPLPGQRVTNLSRESEGSNPSPSSRSSTSSWSEEPALTNMDISTGHMVLSYMEDHMKNKDRLEQEWLALCAYEAEPCATTIALNSENSSKNRYTDVVPYDHARVVLNDLTNLAGSDYINASTITDHDPRNPAYIATQGPLPSTAADLWQMVWEQGSVVMVMLTRLTENGQAMCHRYWPEEGSELYHIYEVHLVSEHIWCDDYLVRSFYLKNLRTGETRTVTQFHFLSWPENGVPHTTKALLEFRRKVNKSYRGRSCPIVVHCSDGAGRTGTYCLMDMVLNRMAKGAKEIDIAATLEHIRDQRPAMVRTREQFVFVLAAVADEVHAILKALPTAHKEQQH